MMWKRRKQRADSWRRAPFRQEGKTAKHTKTGSYKKVGGKPAVFSKLKQRKVRTSRK